jgi:hypothetical protein
MIKAKDVFMPCLKAKNKVVVQSTAKAADLLESNGQTLGENLQELILGSSESQMMLPNFTAQADFASNQLAQEIYEQNNSMVRARYMKQDASAPKAAIIELTKEQRQAIALMETSKHGSDASWGEGESGKEDRPELPTSKLLPLQLDFVPKDGTVLQLARMNFESKQDKISSFVAKRRKQLYKLAE